MAVPTFVAAGARAQVAAATLTPAMPTHQANDILLMMVESANQAITLSDAQGFVETADSPQGTGAAGGTGATRLAVYWLRATGAAMPAPTIADPGDHTLAAIASFRGCITTGNPWDVTAGDTAASSTSVSIPGDTTTTDDCLIVAMGTSRVDNSAAQFTLWANADLKKDDLVTAGVDERINYGTNLGNGGAIGMATGGKAAAGAFGVTTATLNNTGEQARLSLALKSANPGVPGTPATPTTIRRRARASRASRRSSR
jgi:hypothetical protein